MVKCIVEVDDCGLVLGHKGVYKTILINLKG